VPDEGREPLPAELLLQREQLALAGLLDLVGHLLAEGGGGGAVLLVVGEHAHVVELLLLDEVAQLAEVGVGLAGEADDERGAEAEPGGVLADALEDPLLARAGDPRAAWP
jgi:hypothetical protein